jgi:hypothetical protein
MGNIGLVWGGGKFPDKAPCSEVRASRFFVPISIVQILTYIGRGSFPGVKRPGREADHSPPSSAEVKECVELYLHLPHTPSWRGSQLKHRHLRH